MDEKEVNQRLSAFEKSLDLLDDQVQWQKDNIKKVLKKEDKVSVELHLKYAELENVVKLVKEQVEWQRDYVKNYVKTDSEADEQMQQQEATNRRK